MSTQTSLPPGPRRTPWGELEVVLRPDRALAHAIARYGDPFTSRVLGIPAVVTISSEGAKRLLTADPNLFEVPTPEQMVPLLGPSSLLLLVGNAHRAERKLLAPHFHGERMRAYGAVMREVARQQCAKWQRGAPFPVLDTTQAISLEIIIRAVFGVEGERVESFRTTILDFVHSFTPPLVFFRWLRHELGGIGPWDRFIAARAKLDALIDSEATHRASQLLSAEGSARHDILSLLLQARYEDGSAMSRPQIRDELVTLLFAGHETTGISLAWTLYELHRQHPGRPEALARLRAEISALGKDPDPDVLAQLPYLSAVCNETLRLHPVLPIVPPRQVREPFEFLGYQLPAGTMITVGTTRLHKREDLYPNPLEFQPERFLNHTFSPFEYLPFGGGTRRCIGAAFALYEMKIVLATILSSCQLKLASNAPLRELRRNVVMGPEKGVPMLLVSRDP